MLVFVSDLHLTDNTTSKTINPGAFDVFVDDLQWMTQQACTRADADGKRFEALERVDLVMLGDVFDLLRTRRWQADNPAGVRPWTPEMSAPDERDGAHAKLAAFVDGLCADIVARNGGDADARGVGISCLRERAEQGILVRDPDGGEHRVPLRIWYMAGNHDWPLHVGLPAYDAARDRVIAAFGLAHPDASAFAHTHEDTPPELRAVLERHKVVATHGDIFDPNNFPIERPEHHGGREHVVGRGARAHASLGDAIVIEVLNGLPQDILAELDADDEIVSNPSFRAALDELDNVRPVFAMPQWLASVLQHHETDDPALARHRRQAVRRALDAALRRLLDEPFVKRCDRPWHVDAVDALQAGAALNRVVTIDTLSRVSRRNEGKVQPTTYREHAEHELDRLRGHAGGREVEYVVFGHTHHPEVVPLDLDYPRGYVYLNAGTWRRVHRRCVAEHRRIEFLDSHVMSTVVIYADDERGGRPYETWTGTLGLRPDAG